MQNEGTISVCLSLAPSRSLSLSLSDALVNTLLQQVVFSC